MEWIILNSILHSTDRHTVCNIEGNSFLMEKRTLGYLLVVFGIGGMALAGYVFVTGTGGRGHLIEIISLIILGASFFFAGINYIYEASKEFTVDHMITPELEEISPIQQQWRTIHVAKQPVTNVIAANAG